MDSKILACLYCGDNLTPNPQMLESFGGSVKCCDHNMVEIDVKNMYKLLKGLDTLKAFIEKEIVKGFTG